MGEFKNDASIHPQMVAIVGQEGGGAVRCLFGRADVFFHLLTSLFFCFSADIVDSAVCFCVCVMCVCVYAVRWVRCRPLSPPFFGSRGGASVWLLFLFWSFVVGCLFLTSLSFILISTDCQKKKPVACTRCSYTTHLSPHIQGGGVVEYRGQPERNQSARTAARKKGDFIRQRAARPRA